METITSVKNIHNSRVYDANGNDCGHIESLLFDAEDTQLLFAMIALEDGVTRKGTTAIPWNSLNLNPNTEKATLHINKELLYGAPKLNKTDLKLSNRNLYYELLKYYGYSTTKLSPDSPTNQDVRHDYHEKYEGGEFTGTPLDEQRRNNMGEEMNFDKIKGNK